MHRREFAGRAILVCAGFDNLPRPSPFSALRHQKCDALGYLAAGLHKVDNHLERRTQLFGDERFGASIRRRSLLLRSAGSEEILRYPGFW